jgi:hypothetical protein
MVERIAASHPGLPHSLTDTGSNIRLVFPAAGKTGFSVSVEVAADSVRIDTDRGWHRHQRGVSPEGLESAMGLVYDLLTSNARICEHCTRGKPYRWQLEALSSGGEWVKVGSTTLVFWNYFGKRMVTTYQNAILPPRELGTPRAVR